MKVLVIEDDKNKSRQLEEFLLDLLPGCELLSQRSYQSGLKSLLDGPPDILILDMSMPTFDRTTTERGGRTRTYAGRDILREMTRHGIYAHTIVATGFEDFGIGQDRRTLSELQMELADEFPQSYLGTVFYDPARSEWKSNLRNLLQHILNIDDARSIDRPDGPG